MKYIKFLAKCILAATPAIILIAYTLLCPFCYMDEEYPAWSFSKNVAYDNEFEDQDFDTLILGDSGAMSSFVPEVLSDGTVNLAVGGATTIEMYYFLDNYLKNHNAPKHIVMMYQPFHYWHIDNYTTRTQYFKSLSVSEAGEVYTIAKNAGENAIYSDEFVWDELSCRMGLPTKYLPAITASRFVGRYRTNMDAYEELKQSRGYGSFGTQNGCDDVSYEASYTGIEYNGDNDIISQYLIKIIGLCVDEQIDLLITMPALNEATYEKVESAYLSDIRAYMGLVAAYGEYVVCEYEPRCYENRYFGDASHLNREGAVKFSEEIKNTYSEYFE